MDQAKNKKHSYKDAGVSIEQGYELVKRLKQASNDTRRSGVMGSLGGFGALFDLGSLNYKHPVLVSGTDGVGTKIKLAIENNRHETIGVDLVAMCVNDLIVQGAEPLYFLDYFACSSLDVDIAETVINGIATGCTLAGCSLIGGETAEMPDMYQAGDYDLAGFSVGVVEKDNIINGDNVKEGDVLIGLASSGFHSNGYSLIRKIIADTDQDLTITVDQKSLIDHLLEPTRIYVKQVLSLINNVNVKAIAHITGGGLIENVPRVIPENFTAQIDTNSWELPDIFNWLQQQGNVDTTEMYKTFNCGIGMVICIDENESDKALDYLQSAGENCFQIGKIIKNTKNIPIELI